MNIIYIHTHDSGRFLSPYGANVPTDNLLELAKDSIVFRNAYCAGSTCSPSRAALLTGTYPHNNGMYGLAHRGFKLKDYKMHLANYLKEYGYETVLCGVQHEAAGCTESHIAVPIIGYSKNITEDYKKRANEDLVFWDLENAKSAANYIKEAKNKKFFLSFGMFATHRDYPTEIDDTIDERYVSLPYLTFDNEENRKDTAKYHTSAKYADKCIDIVIKALKENGLYDNTLIIFTTDHGIANPFNKCNLLDSGIGVSLIIRNPKQNRQGKVTDSLVSHIDIFPTICDLLGIDRPKWLQGKSLADVLEDEKKEVREEVFAEINYHTSYEPARSIRTKRYKYIKYYDDYNKINYSNIDDSSPKEFLLNNGLKSIKKPMEAFYDLYFDPYERNNLINNKGYKKIIKELKEKLYNWQVETDDPILKKDIPIPKKAKVNKKECISPSSKDRNDYEQLPN
ncbi:sulfatase family protein [Maledivibacter halophilus]|uniref:Arylsulfatase A n=1 Tax=Maledivibacter halophilus TaxID=36842 RepID=A0A1T5M6V8_9FIRM|nr:sulfatase [Maledivibacter halophilus]SKC83609.1 Arylsulfatase A [Maledivibacter halophilus]